jgi:hypothetical protein
MLQDTPRSRELERLEAERTLTRYEAEAQVARGPAGGPRPRVAREDDWPGDEATATEQQAANGAISRMPPGCAPLDRLPQSGTSRVDAKPHSRGFRFRRGGNPRHLAVICLEKERTSRMEAALVAGSLSAYGAPTRQKAPHPWPPP